jgi:hypothetical protein
MSWLSSLFSGDKTATNASNSLLNTGAQATGQGFGDVSSASNFFNSILSGNSSVLAPQIGSIQKQGQQQKQTLSQFGNRGGGTNAEAQTIGDSTKSSINDLITQLTGTAASSLGSLGSSLLNTGTNATSQGAQISLQNKSLIDSLLQSVGAGAGSALTKWALK